MSDLKLVLQNDFISIEEIESFFQQDPPYENSDVLHKLFMNNLVVSAVDFTKLRWEHSDANRFISQKAMTCYNDYMSVLDILEEKYRSDKDFANFKRVSSKKNSSSFCEFETWFAAEKNSRISTSNVIFAKSFERCAEIKYAQSKVIRKRPEAAASSKSNTKRMRAQTQVTSDSDHSPLRDYPKSTPDANQIAKVTPPNSDSANLVYIPQYDQNSAPSFQEIKSEVIVTPSNPTPLDQKSSQMQPFNDWQFRYNLVLSMSCFILPSKVVKNNLSEEKIKETLLNSEKARSTLTSKIESLIDIPVSTFLNGWGEEDDTSDDSDQLLVQSMESNSSASLYWVKLKELVMKKFEKGVRKTDLICIGIAELFYDLCFRERMRNPLTATMNYEGHYRSMFVDRLFSIASSSKVAFIPGEIPNMHIKGARNNQREATNAKGYNHDGIFVVNYGNVSFSLGFLECHGGFLFNNDTKRRNDLEKLYKACSVSMNIIQQIIRDNGIECDQILSTELIIYGIMGINLRFTHVRWQMLIAG